MAGLQKQFEEFHTEILLSNDDGKVNLQKKRDLLVTDLKLGLKREKKLGASLDPCFFLDLMLHLIVR